MFTSSTLPRFHFIPAKICTQSQRALRRRFRGLKIFVLRFDSRTPFLQLVGVMAYLNIHIVHAAEHLRGTLPFALKRQNTTRERSGVPFRRPTIHYRGKVGAFPFLSLQPEEGITATLSLWAETHTLALPTIP